MNYRHGFHAGNFADVFKHVFVIRILAYLLRKDTPLCYIDTHAGSGDYDLAGDSAGRTLEWRGGIGRLAAAAKMPADVAALMAPYRDCVGSADDGGPPGHYPGSPLIAQRLLRDKDRLLLNERQADEAAGLKRAVGRDRRAHVSILDGYEALNAFVPPRERRGLVLVDPPFEAPDEVSRLERAVAKAHRKWPTGVYAIWYPIKDRDASQNFAERLAIGRALRLELLLETSPQPGRHDASALIGCGLIVLNPPFGLADEARVLLPFLAAVLGEDGRSAWLVEDFRDEGQQDPAPAPARQET